MLQGGAGCVGLCGCGAMHGLPRHHDATGPARATCPPNNTTSSDVTTEPRGHNVTGPASEHHQIKLTRSCTTHSKRGARGQGHGHASALLRKRARARACTHVWKIQDYDAGPRWCWMSTSTHEHVSHTDPLCAQHVAVSTGKAAIPCSPHTRISLCTYAQTVAGGRHATCTCTNGRVYAPPAAAEGGSAGKGRLLRVRVWQTRVRYCWRWCGRWWCKRNAAAEASKASKANEQQRIARHLGAGCAELCVSLIVSPFAHWGQFLNQPAVHCSYLGVLPYDSVVHGYSVRVCSRSYGFCCSSPSPCRLKSEVHRDCCRSNHFPVLYILPVHACSRRKVI